MTRGPAASAEAVLDHIAPGTNVIVPLANGEPVALLDALQDHADGLDRVTVHQMHGLHDRPFLHGANRGRLDYRAYFLSHVTRKAFHEGGCDLVPCHFSEVPELLADLAGPKIVLAACAPIDRHGCFSLGTNADYVASFIGKVPFFLEANAQMPRTFGRNQLHVSQVAGWVEVDRPLLEVPPPEANELDDRIAAQVAERIPDGATVQVGIGSIPNAILTRLGDHRDLGLHTELLTDGVIPLVESGVMNGTRKRRRPTKLVATFALGTMHGQGFIVLRSTTNDGAKSRISAQLPPGSVVTTLKNTIDNVVTEWGVAELRGRSLRESAAALIRIAHPDFRDQLSREARDLGYL